MIEQCYAQDHGQGRIIMRLGTSATVSARKDVNSGNWRIVHDRPGNVAC